MSRPTAHARRYVVENGDPRTLRAVLALWGVEPEAAHEGRVFVDRKRATADTPLEPGALVEVYPAQDASRTSDVRILAQRGGVVAVFKPAGIPTIPAHGGTGASVIAAVARLLRIDDPGKVHTSSRLDADVSGVLLAATTARARDALRQARERGDYQRHYVAIAAAVPKVLRATIDEPIGRAPDRRSQRVRGADAVPSVTHYAVVATAGGCALVAAEPVTGRTHQIRVHLAHAGAPLVGDGTYGSRRTVAMPSGAVRDPKRIALHAAWVSVRLGPDEPPWVVRAPVPSELPALWRELGGCDDDWQRAIDPIAA